MAERYLFDALMQGRSEKLDKKTQATGKKQEGGIFDVIFRGKKKREAEIEALKKETDY